MIARIRTALFLLITALSMIPYDQGWISTAFPAPWRPWVTLTGLGSTVFSYIFMGSKKETKSGPTVVNNNYYYLNTATPGNVIPLTKPNDSP